MKTFKLALIGAFFVGITNLTAQEDKDIDTDDSGMVIIDHSNDDFKTILGGGASHGGYISFDLLAGQTTDNQSTLELGGRLGWIMNHGFTFGLAGYGLAGNVDVEVIDDLGQPNTYRLGGGYGGLFIEPILMPKQPVHVSFPIFFGVGAVGYYTPYDQSSWDYEYGAYESDVVTVVRPGVDVEFNITRFFRLGLSANYRFIQNMELTQNESTEEMLPNDFLNSFNYGFSLKFGWF